MSFSPSSLQLNRSSKLSETVDCVVLGKNLPGLPFAPIPGELGQRIQQNVSAQGWQKWLSHQTMLINEKRLSMGNTEHRAYLTDQMEKFLFGGDFDKPAGYKPVEKSES